VRCATAKLWDSEGSDWLTIRSFPTQAPDALRSEPKEQSASRNSSNTAHRAPGGDRRSRKPADLQLASLLPRAACTLPSKPRNRILKVSRSPDRTLFRATHRLPDSRVDHLTGARAKCHPRSAAQREADTAQTTKSRARAEYPQREESRVVLERCCDRIELTARRVCFDRRGCGLRCRALTPFANQNENHKRPGRNRN